MEHIEISEFNGARSHHEFETRSGGQESKENPVADFIALQQAGNHLNARLSGRGLGELQRVVAEEIAANRTQLDTLSSLVVEAGLATWTGDGRGASLIVCGQGKLLQDVTQIERLGAIQVLFERLEAQETMLRLLELAERSDGASDRPAAGVGHARASEPAPAEEL